MIGGDAFQQFQSPLAGPLAGPTGFTGMSPMLGQGFMQPNDPTQQNHGGFGHVLPYLAMGLLGSHLVGPGIMSQFAPLLMGLHKAKAF